MSEHVDRVDATMMSDMRTHLREAMPDASAEAGMSDEQVLNYMDCGGYDGGVDWFCQDNGPEVLIYGDGAA